MTDEQAAFTGITPVTSAPAPHPTKAAKRAKFEELAVPRTKRVIKAIRILANMGGKNRYNYEFAEADVEKIYASLQAEIDQLKVIMVAPGRQLDIEFDL
jgi:hypothetical protein